MNRSRRSIVRPVVTVMAVGGVVAATILWWASPQAGVATAPTTAATLPTRAATTPAPAAPVVITDGCTVRGLPAPSSFPGQPQSMAAVDIDPTGRDIIGSVNDWTVLWVDGKPKILNKGTGSEAIAVNSSGVVVGWNRRVGGWVYRDGRITAPPKLPGQGQAAPEAINSRGDIVGSSGTHGVIWPADQPDHVRPIGVGCRSMDGVSDNGLIVGLLASDNERHLLNRDGTIQPLPAEFPYHPQMIAGPWVLGRADVPDLTTSAVGYRWNVNTGAIVPLTVNTTTAGFLANALGESGEMVGYSPTRITATDPQSFATAKSSSCPCPTTTPTMTSRLDPSAPTDAPSSARPETRPCSGTADQAPLRIGHRRTGVGGQNCDGALVRPRPLRDTPARSGNSSALPRPTVDGLGGHHRVRERGHRAPPYVGVAVACLLAQPTRRAETFQYAHRITYSFRTAPACSGYVPFCDYRSNRVRTRS